MDEQKVRIWTADQPWPSDDELPEEEITAIAGWYCANCFDGWLHLPLYEDLQLVDQSVDLDLVNHPVRRIHRCTFTKILSDPPSRQRDMLLAFARAGQLRGKWQATTFALPLAVKQLILDHWASPAAPTDTWTLQRLKARASK